jgi:hypothetical protein
MRTSTWTYALVECPRSEMAAIWVRHPTRHPGSSRRGFSLPPMGAVVPVATACGLLAFMGG